MRRNRKYIHVVNRFVGYMNDPLKLKIDDEKERADYVARVEEGLHYLNVLYTMSLEEKITLLRQTSEMFEEDTCWQGYTEWEQETRGRMLMERDECMIEWFVLSNKRVEVVKEYKDTKDRDEGLLANLPRCDLSIMKTEKSIADNFPQCLVERLQQVLHRHLEIHGLDVSWMVSIIGLRLSVPEWWWEDGSGNRYSKCRKLWRGEIVDVSLPDYVLGLYQFWNCNGDGYFITLCSSATKRMIMSIE